MIELTKLFALPKFEGVRGSTPASLKISEIMAIRKQLARFFNFSLSLRYLLTDIELIQNEMLALVWPAPKYFILRIERSNIFKKQFDTWENFLTTNDVKFRTKLFLDHSINPNICGPLTLFRLGFLVNLWLGGGGGGSSDPPPLYLWNQ